MQLTAIRPLAFAVSLAAAGQAGADAFAIEEIVVTATKRAESIQDVPISVSAFSGDFMEKSGVEDLQGLGNIAPNLSVTKSTMAVNQRIMIRGVGTVGNNAMDPSVAVYVDGAYIPRPGAIMGNLKDIEVAEVLRGPQGTLFGRNAAMGALNIRTNKPEMDTLSLKIDAGMDDYDGYDTTIIANAGINESLAARVVANYTDKGGYGENLYDGDKDVGGNSAESIKPSFLYEPTEDLSILLRLDYQELQGEGAINEVLPESATTANLATLNFLGIAPDVSGLDHTINQAHNDSMTDRQWGATLDVTWDDVLDGHTLRSITSYRDWQNDTIEYSLFRLPMDDMTRDTHFASDSVSQEIQLISPTGDVFDYVAGLYYFQEDYEIDQTVHLGADFCPLTGASAAVCAAGDQYNANPALFNQDAESLAVFFQGTFHITDRFDVITGLRYTDDKKDGSLLVTPNNLVTGGLIGSAEDKQLKFDDSQVNWMLNARYFFTPDIMGFATASTGYKSGGLNSLMTGGGGLTESQRVFDSEEVTNYELGLKTTLLDGSLVANVTAFRTDIENFQDRSFQDLTFVIANAGELRQQGIELDVQYSPMQELFVSLGYAYLDSEFLSFDNGSPLPGVAGTQDLSGTANRYSPEHQINLTSQWTQALGDTGMEWFLRGEVMWTDDADVGATTNNNPQTIQDAYSLVNLRAGLESEDGVWSVSAYVENLADEEYCVGMYDQPNGGAFGTQINGTTLIRCVQGDPRTIGIRGSYSFD
ncbi:TonB-dependent receptor [Maricurvus nonylphenolicus]|uniref:TonB-dependent receptor n=1 Tax=Maricurvus nonylphenolicus TaxID=1008307 RepID=UPI0036F360B7